MLRDTLVEGAPATDLQAEGEAKTESKGRKRPRLEPSSLELAARATSSQREEMIGSVSAVTSGKSDRPDFFSAKILDEEGK